MIVEKCENDGEHFLSEIGWREFSNTLLYHFPDIPRENLQKKFDAFPWREDAAALRAWQSGQTGYPIVDAGMRELWKTGYMHNRVRMIVASFLVKNQLINWRDGEAWFWDCLVDADLASNSASWQWSAGCGADAAPYFRIFNPYTQGKRFDSGAKFVFHYCPELRGIDRGIVHEPERWPKDVRNSVDYPNVIIRHGEARARAMTVFKKAMASR